MQVHPTGHWEDKDLQVDSPPGSGEDLWDPSLAAESNLAEPIPSESLEAQSRPTAALKDLPGPAVLPGMLASAAESHEVATHPGASWAALQHAALPLVCLMAATIGLGLLLRLLLR